jgi:ATP-binding cassette, subfamily B (MDR/TAP), member 1
MNLLFTILLDMAQASAAANRILSFRVKSSTASKTLLELQETEGGVEIELQDLWFKYPTRDIPIFTGLNLTVRISLQPRNELF